MDRIYKGIDAFIYLISIFLSNIFPFILERGESWKDDQMMKRMSIEIVKKTIEDNECVWISGEYKSCKSILEILFACGHKDFRNFTIFKNKEKLCRRCIAKSKNRVPRNSWNIKTMNDYCRDNNIDYDVLDTRWEQLPYQKQLWSLVKCPNNEHPAYWTWWNNFINGYHCVKCYSEEFSITFWNDEKVINFYSEFGLEILDINEWKDVDGYIYCINKDGYYVRANISNLKTYKKYPKWGPNLFKGNKYAIENIKIFCKKERPDYEILSDHYTGIKDLYLFQYNGVGLSEDADKRFYTSIDCFYHGKIQHPNLNKTKAEIRIENFLVKNNINYKFQFTDHNCRNFDTGWKLKFDFGVFDNNNLIMIIESDGTSHDTVVEYWGGEETLKDLQKRDEIKNEYCKNNGIYLLRINHKDDKNMESILTRELNILRKEVNID
jgi:hypothetical protein